MQNTQARQQYSIIQGDVRETLRRFPDKFAHALLCDPPYGLSFMGKKWDYAIPATDVWAEALRVLRPGAPLLSFGGSRTYHRLACGIEDAGFELRDCLMWLYAKGMPHPATTVDKWIDAEMGTSGDRAVIRTVALTGNAAVSLKDKGGTYGVQVGTVPAKEYAVTSAAHPLAKEWEGYGGALKPCHEPIVMARRPLEGTNAQNILVHGVAGLNVPACRVERDDNADARAVDEVRPTLPARDGTERGARPFNSQVPTGGWPSNVIMDEEAGAILDEDTGPRPSNPHYANTASGAVANAPETRTPGGSKSRGRGPSRFFFSAKVSTNERNAGCEHLARRSAAECVDRTEGSVGIDRPQAGAGRSGGANNHHPTLKPLALVKWLAVLVKPPTAGAILLVPFCGSGSEIVGALQAGWPTVIGIEMDPEYVEIAHARIAHWMPGAVRL